MSSLMQHHGGRSADGRKVELFMYLVTKGKDWDKYNGPNAYRPSPEGTAFCDDAEPVILTKPDGSTKTVPRLYRIYRRPRGMCGCWVIFRYNGADQVPDLSIPIAIHKLPRDATPLTDTEASAYWFTH
jgi:hypothetical protein